MMPNCGQQLIFLISQPRSGSTLLQHILGAHSEIHTLPEPWLMLHLVYGLRSSGLKAEYNAQYAHLGTKDFLARIPDGETAYLDALRILALSIYQKALEPSGKRFFLDKTPRYYFIIPELYRLFPAAKFVILLRNPLAVLSSILETNFGGNWQGFALEDRQHDILSAPKFLVEGIKILDQHCAVIHYEQLVAEPQKTVENLCQHLGVSFECGMLEYGGKVRFQDTTFVDPKSIYKHQHPVTDYLDEWLVRFDTPQKVHIAKSYLATLERETVASLGYNYDDLIDKVNALASSKKPLVVPWKLLIKPLEKRTWGERLRMELMVSLQQHGIRGTLLNASRHIFRRN